LLERINSLWSEELVDFVPAPPASADVYPLTAALTPGELLLQPVIKVDQLHDLKRNVRVRYRHIAINLASYKSESEM
jgi:hypothetical protein